MKHRMPNILIVEDEEIIRCALRQLLERHNYRVSDAVSVKAACSKFDVNTFALIITDLRLPGGFGSAFIDLAPHVPVIVMTSYASLRSAVDTMRQGAVDYICKPFKHNEMLVAVERAIKTTKKGPSARYQPAHIGHFKEFKDLSLKEYFTEFVRENQSQLSETALAKKLGISRKSLWERRQKYGILRDERAE